MMFQIFTISNLIVTSIFLGVILIIQLIHYPAFLWVASADFATFHLQHTRVMGYIASPLMILELMLACIGLVYFLELSKWNLIINFLLVLFLWSVTFFKSVPIHSVLAVTKDIDLIHQLISSNWLRTIGWVLKFMIALILVFMSIR